MTPNNLQISQLEKIYQLANKEEIVQFLAKYPELPGMLIDAEKPIRKYFDQADLSLRFVADIEEPNWQRIFVNIRHDYPEKQLESKMLDLIGEWFIPLTSPNKIRLILTDNQI